VNRDNVRFRVDGFLDFARHPEFQITRKHNASEKRSASVFREEGPNRVCVSIHSPEEENSSSLRNIVFASYLESRMMDRVQKPSDSENL
jgi:hypothetical protein